MRQYLKLQTKMTRAKPRMVSCGRSGHTLAHKRANVQTRPPRSRKSFNRRRLAELVIIILLLAWPQPAGKSDRWRGVQQAARPRVASLQHEWAEQSKHAGKGSTRTQIELTVTFYSEKQGEMHSFQMALTIKPHVKIQIPHAISTRENHVLQAAHSA